MAEGERVAEQPPEPARARTLTRRGFLATSAGAIGTVLAWQVRGPRPVHAAPAPQSGPAAIPVPLNEGWLFGPSVAGGTAPGFDDSGMDTVTVPHTVTPVSWRLWNPANWEQVWLYRNHFDAPPGSAGMRVFVDFAGAMTGAALSLNGQSLPGHVGGYLPFGAELTGALLPAGNVLAVVLDSTFNLDVPPDRPAPATSSSVDYWQPGGIYRDVSLRVVPQVFLADLFAKPVNVLDAAQRQVLVQFTLDAAAVPQGAVTVTVDLRDGDRKVASTTVPVTVTATGQVTGTATLSGLSAITLWDPDRPKLYDVVATLSIGGTAVHDYRTSIGFREARFTLDGFFLNGRRLKLFGVNRHQIFPFAGDAMPGRVQQRDAQILRTQLNCNMVRCSHYPQSEAFLDACDQLGLMVWQEMPGWGFFGDAAWQAAGYQDLHDMIVRDRNHPSIVVWGSMPNEAGEHVSEYTLYNQLAHSLDDSRPTGGDGSTTDATFLFDVFSIHDYSSHTGSDGLRVPDLKPPVDAAGRPYLVCEAVGTLSGPALFYRRTDQQFVQQGQATAHARVHDIAAADDRYCGVLAWSGFDYESGSGNQFQGIKYTGVVDIFRVPLPGAAIYQAQVDPHTRPVIVPAFYWDFGPTSPINQLGGAMVCSNLDRLEVYVAGAHFATVTPDTNDYGHLPYPPSFVDFSSVSGAGNPELRIDGYLGATQVASQTYSSDPSGDRLALVLDDEELLGDGSDATRAWFRAVDTYGRPRPYVTGDVTLTVSGPAALVGDNPFPFTDTGGAGAVWLRTVPNSPGAVTITAAHPTLGHATASLRVRMPSPGGTPAPYGALQATTSTALAIPGGTVTISATFTNNGLPNLDSLALGVQVPDGWPASPTSGTTFTGVKSGAQVIVSWQISVPAAAQPGPREAVVMATYGAHNETGHSSTDITLTVPYPSLSAAFNNAGISDDSNVAAATLDGVGNSYSEQALTAAGLAPGATITQSGVTFTWPDVPAAQPDNVVADGQTVLATGSGATLGFLGAGSPSDVGGSGTVYYTDGSTSTFAVTLDNYFNPGDTSGDVAIATMPYVNDSNPATNGGSPQRNHTVYVFFTGASIEAGKTVQAVTLPAGGIIPPSGRITGMHVFALAVGG